MDKKNPHKFEKNAVARIAQATILNFWRLDTRKLADE